MRRRSASGSEVRIESRVVRFCIERFSGTVMGMISPDMFLTKICMLSTGSGDTERESGEEERIMDVD